ncbi:MAG: glycosyltransferase family 4 protein [Acidobacteriota bacterium]|nr:glycosyltransferase family 4 protein [Acidobacteriota bacterium]
MHTHKLLRVGYVVKRYPRFSETFIVNEILAHERAGLEVEVFALYPPNDTHFQNAISKVRAPVTYLPSAVKIVDFWAALEAAGAVLPGFWEQLEHARGDAARDVYQAASLAHLAHAREIQHLHAHFASMATSVARLAARFAGIPYTFTAHAKDIFHESVVPEDLRRKLEEAAGIVTVSEFNLQFLSENYGTAAGRVERIYNGLDLDGFPYQSPGERPPRIISVGRLVEKKGFGDLIEACAILAGRKVDFTCQIIGTGELESDLRRQIESARLQSHVELTGPRPQSEVIELVQSAAVFAAPCVIGTDGNRDGLPTVLLEAMALGTPCVSTDVTGIPEVLRDGETGLMTPQHDPATLADVLEGLLVNPALRVHLAQAARRLIEAEFDVHRNAACVREMFQRARIAPSGTITSGAMTNSLAGVA